MAADAFKRWTIAFVVTAASVMKSSCTDFTNIPGLTTPDDPHACVWFTGHNGSRCCDGYFKSDATNLTGKCIECPRGSFGFFCLNVCTCENGGSCDTVDGSCRCTARYFGNNCQYPCNCQNGAICMHDGRCMCADGFYGELCQRKCSCPENSKCNSETRECFCHDGFYGDSCLPCNCSNTEQCDHFTGACSCRPGYYGDNCDKQCSCFNGAYCGYENYNNCICPSGWAGPECTDCDTGVARLNQFCKDKCLHCYNGHMCSVEYGDCECSPGWQGNRCDKQCKSGFYGNNCSKVCRCEHGICNHMTGICQCQSGWTGQHCEEPCPDNCLVCTGDICISCEPGWTGEHCSNTCKPGFYGDSCREICKECRCSSCHYVNGSCPDVVRCKENKCKYQNARQCKENPLKLECQDGWTGFLCDVKTTMIRTEGTVCPDITQTNRQGGTQRPTGDGPDVNESYSHTLIVIGAVIIVPLVVVYMLIFYYLMRMKKIPEISLFKKVHGKNLYSDHEKGTPTPELGDDNSEPYLTAQSAAATNNINERDSFITTNVQDTELKPIHTSLSKHKSGTQLRKAIEENNQDTGPMEHDSFIHSKATISNPTDDATKASSFKGPYEIIFLDQLDQNEYDKLDRIGVKLYKNSDTDDGAYERLKYT